MWKREALKLERDRDAWRAHARELLEEMTRRRPGGQVASADVLLNEPGVGGVGAEKRERD